MAGLPVGKVIAWSDVEDFPLLNLQEQEQEGEETEREAVKGKQKQDSGCSSDDKIDGKAKSRPKARISGRGFEIDRKINQKLCILYGKESDFANLGVTAIVNRTNDKLNDWSGLSGEILKFAGASLKEECGFVPTRCQTGECKITRACQLEATYVIHTVGPKYTEQYKIAAESALHNCYKSCISVAKEESIRTIAFPCIYSEKKEFPRDNGAHVAVRTIRRFLEKFESDFDRVVFFLDNEKDLQFYKTVLALYCPRNEKELDWSQCNLPPDTGNDWGEIVPEDRKIRIKSSLFQQPVSSSSSCSNLNGSAPKIPPRPNNCNINANEATTIVKDQTRIERDQIKEQYQEVVYGIDTMMDNANYASYLKRAKEQELKDIFALNILYQSGVDAFGRAIVVFAVSNMNVRNLDLERLFLFAIELLDEIVSNPLGYVMVILDDNVDNAVFPSIGWIKSLYEDVIGRKYKKNIKGMYVVHPTLGTKMLFWGAVPFVSSKFWDKFYYIETLDELYRYLPADQLILPKVAYQNDKRAKESWF